jgi:chemotaxis family two-component system sensor kinase Cph1
VLAVKLSTSQPDYLMWFRKEQLLTVTWAGDPAKPMVDNDPLHLSPRRSFAAWSELVRGTACPGPAPTWPWAGPSAWRWSTSSCRCMRCGLLVAERQLAGIRNTVRHSSEPVLIADAQGALLCCNPAFCTLTGRAGTDLPTLPDLAQVFTHPHVMQQALAALKQGQPTWRGEMALARVPTSPCRWPCAPKPCRAATASRWAS